MRVYNELTRAVVGTRTEMYFLDQNHHIFDDDRSIQENEHLFICIISFIYLIIGFLIFLVVILVVTLSIYS